MHALYMTHSSELIKIATTTQREKYMAVFCNVILRGKAKNNQSIIITCVIYLKIFRFSFGNFF